MEDWGASSFVEAMGGPTSFPEALSGPTRPAGQSGPMTFAEAMRAPASRPQGHPAASEPKAETCPPVSVQALAEQSRAQLQTLSSLVGPYHLAVASLDPAATRELAGNVVATLEHLRAAHVRMKELDPSGEVAAPFAQDLDTAIASLAVQLSPQMLGATLVVSSVTPPPRAQVRHLGARLVASEAARVVALLEAAQHITGLVAPEGDAESVAANDFSIQDAIDEYERFTSRPIDAAFLARALEVRGVWLEISQARTQGPNAGQQLRRAQAQGDVLGMTADVGPTWNEDEATDALSYGVADWAVSEPEAMRVIEMLRAANPQAGAGLVKELHRRGLLHRLAENVGWAYVKQLAESLNDPQAEALLDPYWRGKGDTPSLGQLLDGNAQENRQHGGVLGHVKAFAWDTLNHSLDALTFGAKPALDRAHEALNAGMISEDTYGTQASLGIGRAGLIAGATALFGGPAGAWGEGAAMASGAGAEGSAVIGATASGAMGAAGGHLAGDAFDQTFAGKEGFDSLGAYGKTFAEGGLMGAAAAPMGLAAARYLPDGVRTMAQQIAARHPELVRVLQASQAAGIRASFRIRLTVREWLRMFDGASGGGPMAGGGFAFAFAGGAPPSAAELARLPPDAEIWITARPRADLSAQQSRLEEDGPLFDIDELEVAQGAEDRRARSGNLFDEHEPGADYGDSPHDSYGDAEPVSRAEDGDSHTADVLSQHGTSTLHANRLGITRTPRHHLLPQEHIEFFEKRGFKNREIDDFCIEVTEAEHYILHSRHRDWSKVLMRRLQDREQILSAINGQSTELNRSEVLQIMHDTMEDFDIADLEIVPYAD